MYIYIYIVEIVIIYLKLFINETSNVTTNDGLMKSKYIWTLKYFPLDFIRKMA